MANLNKPGSAATEKAAYGQEKGTEPKEVKELPQNVRRSLQDLGGHNELILNAAGEGIFGLDVEGKHTFVNPAAARMLGYAIEEMVGQCSHTMWHHTKADGTSFPANECPIYRAYMDGVTYHGENEIFWRKDGTSFPAEYKSTPIRNNSGDLVGAVVIFQDISHRRECEEAIGRLRRHNDLILNAAGEGIFGLDVEGKHTFVNPSAARMLGYTVGELMGKPSHPLWHHTKADGSSYPAQECPIYAAYKDGVIHRGDDELFWRKDGTSFPVEYTSTPIRNESGELVGAVVTFQDITERQRIAAKLLEEEKLAEVTRVLGDIGHDIKNMLMPVLNGAWLLQDELKDHFGRLSNITGVQAGSTQDLTKEIIEMIRNNARRIQERVREIADAVKGVTSPPQFGPCRIEKVAADVMATLRIYGDERGVTLQTKELEALPLIEADERRLFNAFYNLINNAISEVPAGGSVTVHSRSEADGKTVLLSVADTGRGMPPEVLDSLFTGRAVSRKAGGTGLGTKIVKDVVDAHGGTITAESQEGVGTTFYIKLPISRNNG